MITSFIKGAGYIAEGLKWPLTKSRSLLVYVAIPAVINVLLFALFAAMLVGWGGDLIDWLQGLLGEDHEWYLAVLVWLAQAMMWVVVVVIAVGVSFATVYLLGNLIAAPFNDLLSEKVEAIRLGAADEPFSLKRALADAGFTIGQELRRLLFFAVVSVGLLFLNLVPVVGSAAYAVLGALFTALFIALEYLDLPMARRRHRFRARWGVVWTHRSTALGFGGAAALLLWIPLLNFVCIPAAVIGGTLLYADLVESGDIARTGVPGAPAVGAGGVQTPEPPKESA